ncbi:MAG: LamG domain-containing protein, partial [Lentisphaerae bacterium]|nr:LamG domain-containing protein [Lentisphaerota bacterium]
NERTLLCRVHRDVLLGPAGLTCGVRGRTTSPPVAHWTFDDIRDTTVPDAAGSHPGTLCGRASRPEIVDGIAGKALRFTPGSEHYVRVDQMAELCPTQQITLMAWVWIDSKTAMWGDILGYQPEQSRGDKAHPLKGFRLWKTWGCKSIRFYIGDGTTRAYKNEIKCEASGLRRLQNHWMHIAATHDGQVMRMFINAVEKGHSEATAQIAPSGFPLVIGNYAVSKTVYPFHGVIDDVRIYDVALTEDQILGAAATALAE